MQSDEIGWKEEERDWKQRVAQQNNMRNQICKFWRDDLCKKGDNCNWRHEWWDGEEAGEGVGAAESSSKALPPPPPAASTADRGTRAGRGDHSTEQVSPPDRKSEK